MSKIKSKIYKFAKVPISITFKKLLRKAVLSLYLPIKRKYNLINSTYSDNQFARNNYSIINPKFFNYNDINHLYFIDKANNFINRSISILGSQRINPNYSSSSYGFLGINYRSNKNYKSIIDYIKQEINIANIDKSLEIANLIRKNYSPIDWQLDLRSGYRWEVTKWHKEILIWKNGADAKVPWEIGRMHQAIDIAMSYAALGDNIYADEFMCQVYDFYSTNPPSFGIQWKSAMDASIRIINLLIAKDIFEQAGYKFPYELEMVFSNMVFDHFKFINENKEWSSGMRANHYLSNLTGMIACLFYYELPNSKMLRKKISKELESEINYQFNNDGGNFEDSTSYHFHSCEFVFYALLFLSNKDIESKYGKIEYKPVTLDKLRIIINFSNAIVNDNYLDPRFGDDDSGSLIKFRESDESMIKIDIIAFINSFAGVNQSQSLASQLFKIPKILDKKIIKNNYFICKDFGLGVFQNDSYYFAIKSSSVGQNRKGGHSHDDALSFVMNIGKNQIIVDPGTFCYAPFPKYRNQFRSGQYHNSIQLNNISILEFADSEPDDIFWTKKENAILRLEKHEKGFIAKAKFRRGDIKLVRKVNFYNNKIILEDNLTNIKSAKLNFHLHPSLSNIVKEGNSIELRTEKNLLRMKFEKDFEIKEYEFSPSYGYKERAKKLEIDIIAKSHTTEIEILQ